MMQWNVWCENGLSCLISHWQNHTVVYGHTAAPVHDGRSPRGSTARPAQNVLPINQMDLSCILTSEVVEVTFVHAVMRRCKQKRGGEGEWGRGQKSEVKVCTWPGSKHVRPPATGGTVLKEAKGLQGPELIGQVD